MPGLRSLILGAVSTGLVIGVMVVASASPSLPPPSLPPPSLPRVMAARPPGPRPARLAPVPPRLAGDLRALWRDVRTRFPAPTDRALVVVDVHTQRLYLLRRGRVADVWPVSTAIDGIGQEAESDATPVGVFRVARKIGAGLPPEAVLRDQVATGRIVAPVRAPDDPAASRWITTRILWLSGLQPGWNEGGDDDTFLRHIYIHGTANLGMLGRPASQGCVQMAPRAVMALYRAVPVGTPVLITPGTGRVAAIPGPGFG